MNKFYIGFMLLMLFPLANTFAQKKSTKNKNTPEQKEIIAVIQKLFEGMKKGDSAMVGTTFHPSIRFQTSFVDQEGKPRLATENSATKFLTAVGTPHNEVWDERIKSYEIRVDDNLATAWTPYSFYLDDKLSHCGVNTFVLCKTEQGWKITHIADTRRKDCK